jgi:7,8-dihydropterin-6-yl-methyl-4-(beta-D-ribofuranosyl)aminobenzene 5'-phosphate synthase
VHALKITILSTMLADGGSLGEWGFSALVVADGHRILFDTGNHSDVVLRNAGSLGVDLASIPEVILSHNHGDHVGGLLTLRRAAMAKAPGALGRTHVAQGIFFPRRSSMPGVEVNPMILIKPQYEETGGVFIVHDRPAQIYPGVWLTGPVPRRYPERNWSGNERVRTPEGTVEDNIPEDMSLVLDTDQGLVILTGCGHAGIANIVDYSRSIVRPARIHAIVGGIHLFDASDQTVEWTARKLGESGVDNFIGAHCTGVETVFSFRRYLGLDRAHAVVGAVGASFELGRGIDPGHIAQ